MGRSRELPAEGASPPGNRRGGAGVQSAAAWLVAILSVALILVSALCVILLTGGKRPAPFDAESPPAPVRTQASFPASEPLRLPEPPEEPPPADPRIYLPPFEAERPAEVSLPPLSDAATEWEQSRDPRLERARRSIALLLRDGTTPVAGVPAAAGGVPARVAAPKERAGGIHIVAAPPALRASAEGRGSDEGPWVRPVRLPGGRLRAGWAPATRLPARGSGGHGRPRGPAPPACPRSH